MSSRNIFAAEGKAAYDRKQVREESLEFGECIMWKRQKTRDINMLLDARCTDGTVGEARAV